MTHDTAGILSERSARNGEDRAIVIGAGLGGLLVARAIADHFAEVLVLDRDILPGSPAQRRNVPQGHHVHALLARGRMTIESFFPGIGHELVRDGAIRAETRRDLTWFQMGGYHATPNRGQEALLQSRPLLEFHIRRRVAALPNVVILDGCQVNGLLATRDPQRVTGVLTSLVSEPDREHELAAALTVDASGRGSRLPSWLERLGYEVPPPVSAGVEARYATRLFRRDPDSDARPATVIVASAGNRRGGVALAQEGDRWLVTLASRGGAQPPSELPAYIEWARSLEAPDIYRLIRHASPLDDGAIYRFSRSTRRLYERMERFPDGVLPAGDALCSFNPVYAQGMTIAAIEAEQLGACLASGTGDLARRYFSGIAVPVEAAWKMAAAGDMRYADDPVELPRAAQAINAYMARLLVAAQVDPVVAEAFQRVQNLIDLPPSLMRPSVAIRVALATLRHPAPRTATRHDLPDLAPRRAASPPGFPKPIPMTGARP